MSKQELAIIGRADVVKPFQLVGIHGYEVVDAVMAVQVLEALVKAGTAAVVFIAEDIARDCLPDIERIKKLPVPAVFILPGRTGTALGLERLEQTLAKAIGKKL